MNGHLFVPNDLEELRWVTTHAYDRGNWHWLGFFCNTGNSKGIKGTRTVTREDTTLIASKMTGARGNEPLHYDNEACWMHQSELRDSKYDKLSPLILLTI